jgi:hypothetical protein
LLAELVMIVARTRQYLRHSLDAEQRKRLARFQALKFRRLQHLLFRTAIGRDLKALALVNNTDKWGSHWYAQHYERHFGPWRRRPVTLLEIGIGGYKDPRAGGGSLRMWRTYFPHGRIYGLDIHDKRPHDERRITTFRGSQTDEQFLSAVLAKTGPPDIVIDDGSHENAHVLQTFRFLFPRMADEGIYVVEDTQTSYWESAGGSSTDLDGEHTTMGVLKRLADGLNYREFERPGYQPSYFDRHVTGIAFYHNIVFIQKGLNDEHSDAMRARSR